MKLISQPRLMFGSVQHGALNFSTKMCGTLQIPGWGGVTRRQDLKYDGGCREDLQWLGLPRRVPETWWLFQVILAAPTPLPSPVAGGAYTGSGKGRVEKNWQMRASKVLQNSMFSFLSNFNLSLTSLCSFPAGLARLCTCPVLQRPSTRCFWWYSPLRSGISIPVAVTTCLPGNSSAIV